MTHTITDDILDGLLLVAEMHNDVPPLVTPAERAALLAPYGIAARVTEQQESAHAECEDAPVFDRARIRRRLQKKVAVPAGRSSCACGGACGDVVAREL